MQNLIPIFFIIFFAYLIFSRKGGGMGCCGGHMGPEPSRNDHMNHNMETTHNTREQVIDLRDDEYTVIESEDKKLPRT